MVPIKNFFTKNENNPWHFRKCVYNNTCAWRNTAGLCNGSTPDSDSVCEGSNPSPAAREKQVYGLASLFLFCKRWMIRVCRPLPGRGKLANLFLGLVSCAVQVVKLPHNAPWNCKLFRFWPVNFEFYLHRRIDFVIIAPMLAFAVIAAMI